LSQSTITLKGTGKPGIHGTVDDWVVHGVTHSEPVADEVNVLNRRVLSDVRM